MNKTQLNQAVSNFKPSKCITQAEAINRFSSSTGTHACYELQGGGCMKQAIFNFNEYGVRIALNESNDPLFCLIDISNALGIQRANPNRFKLNPKGVHSLCTLTSGGSQKLTFISEENLYRIVFRSTKPEALNFQNWVFAEVLPTIRKTGSCSARQTAYEELNRLCMQEKVSKVKGTFHSHGMHKRKREKHLNAVRIQTCEHNLQLTFEGVCNA